MQLSLVFTPSLPYLPFPAILHAALPWLIRGPQNTLEHFKYYSGFSVKSGTILLVDYLIFILSKFPITQFASFLRKIDTPWWIDTHTHTHTRVVEQTKRERYSLLDRWVSWMSRTQCVMTDSYAWRRRTLLCSVWRSYDVISRVCCCIRTSIIVRTHSVNFQWHTACLMHFICAKIIIVPHRIIWSWYTGRWWVGC